MESAASDVQFLCVGAALVTTQNKVSGGSYD